MNEIYVPWFQTMDGKAVTLHEFNGKMPSPEYHLSFWAWAYRCMKKISLLSASFRTIDGTCEEMYYEPCLRIWYYSGQQALSFTLLGKIEEDENIDDNLPLYCLCTADWLKESRKKYREKVRQHGEILDEDDARCCQPIQVQFLCKENCEHISLLLKSIITQIQTGVSINQVTEPPAPEKQFLHEFMIEHLGISLSYSIITNLICKELAPLIDECEKFFTGIRDELGILPSESPVISFESSTYESYNFMLERTQRTHGTTLRK